MKLTEDKKIKHVAYTIATGFICSSISFSCSLFFPPDMSAMPPVYPVAGIVFQEISMALLIFGCTVLSIKLAEEKKTLPAAGFTMMSIAQGLYFVLFFMGFDNVESLEEGYKTFCGFIYLFLPSLILISFYSDFPRWVNILGVVACLPNIYVYIKFMSTQKYSVDLDYAGFLAFILLSITSLIWGILILRNMKNELRSKK